MSTTGLDRWFRGRSAVAAAASSSTSFDRSYRGAFGVPVVKLSPSVVMVYGLDGIGIADRSSVAAFTTTAITSMDAFGASDGRQPRSAVAAGLFDAFTDMPGTSLETHPPTSGSGGWTIHPSYSSSLLQIDGSNRVFRGASSASPSLYLASVSAIDGTISWTTMDNDVTYAYEAQCGCGLRVSDSADTGYFAVGENDDVLGVYRWVILKRVAGVETALVQTAKAVPLLTSTALEFTASGSTLSLSIDGVPTISTTDSSIAGPGYFAILFRPVAIPDTTGAWLDDVGLGAIGVPALRFGPERVDAAVYVVQAWGLDERSRITASVRSAESIGFVETWTITVAGPPVVWIYGLDQPWGMTEGRSLAAQATFGDASGCLDVLLANVALRALESPSLADRPLIAVQLAGIDSIGWDEAYSQPDPIYSGPVWKYGVDGGGGLDEAGSIQALVRGSEGFGWDESWLTAVGIFSGDAGGFASRSWVRVIVATLTYTIYGNDGAGGPIDYATPLGTTTTQSWPTPPLGTPGHHRFGVRVTSAVSGLEEQNADAVVEIILDATGVDVTNRPRPVFNLRAYSLESGLIRVEWSHPISAGSRKPTGFRIYAGWPTPNYTTPIATILSSSARFAGSYQAQLSGLTDGSSYAIAVRAYNATAEDAGTTFVVAKSDGTAPEPIDGLSGAATAVE